MATCLCALTWAAVASVRSRCFGVIGFETLGPPFCFTVVMGDVSHGRQHFLFKAARQDGDGNNVE